jgi:hypothetical protein
MPAISAVCVSPVVCNCLIGALTADRLSHGYVRIERADSGNDEAASPGGEPGRGGFEFSADELDDITTAAANLQLVGDRRPEAFLNLTGQ